MSEQPADQWERDLNPDGFHEQAPDRMATAYDHKSIHARLEDFTSDELKRIPVLINGTRLEQGATYLDLSAETATFEPWTAMGGETAGPEQVIVPKSEVDYHLWNRLTDTTPEA